jgi:hypothetical protein
MRWKVPAQLSASLMTVPLSPRTFRVMRSTRFDFSTAENVISRIRRGSAPLTMRCATRCARVFVLPDPAPAMIRSGIPM